jgi:hypothetical protein
MANTKKYAAELTGLTEKAENLVKALQDSFGFKLKSIIETHASLFDRFCPFQIDDQVELTITPEISETVRHRWLGAKHFLIAGAIAVVVDRGYRDDKFLFGLKFEGESWIDRNGTEKAIPYDRIYYFSEDFVKKAKSGD